MQWLVNTQVLDADGERFVRADIGVEGERIARIVTSASPEAGDDVVDLAGCVAAARA